MERKLTSEEEFELKKIKEESVYYNEPAYEFEIGDHIRYGYDSTAIVSYISQDKKFMEWCMKKVIVLISSVGKN